MYFDRDARVGNMALTMEDARKDESGIRSRRAQQAEPGQPAGGQRRGAAERRCSGRRGSGGFWSADAAPPRPAVTRKSGARERRSGQTLN